MSNDNVLITGDLARLKSGGPTMTVAATFPPEKTVVCQRFQDGRMITELFRADTLARLPPDTQPDNEGNDPF